MNFRQIEYFLAVADHLSFSYAARALYMTQPALGRQIRALETDLNVELFYRGKRQLKLTPAGAILNNELRDVMKSFNAVIEKARSANDKSLTHLRIGILEGHHLGELFPAIYDNFRTNHPNVQVDTHRCSFGPLVEELYQGDADIIITLDFDLVGKQDVAYREISVVHNFLVVPAAHRLADKTDLKLHDFKDDVFIINSPDDSRQGYQNLVEECKRAGFYPKLKLASSLDEYMLWCEMGYGVTVLSEHSLLKTSPRIKFLTSPKFKDAAIAVAYLKDNENSSVKAFMGIIDELLRVRDKEKP